MGQPAANDGRDAMVQREQVEDIGEGDRGGRGTGGKWWEKATRMGRVRKKRGDEGEECGDAQLC